MRFVRSIVEIHRERERLLSVCIRQILFFFYSHSFTCSIHMQCISFFMQEEKKETLRLRL